MCRISWQWGFGSFSSICLRCSLRTGTGRKVQNLLVKLKCRYSSIYLHLKWLYWSVSNAWFVVHGIRWTYITMVMKLSELVTSAFGTSFILGEIRPFSMDCWTSWIHWNERSVLSAPLWEKPLLFKAGLIFQPTLVSAVNPAAVSFDKFEQKTCPA